MVVEILNPGDPLLGVGSGLTGGVGDSGVGPADGVGLGTGPGVGPEGSPLVEGSVEVVPVLGL
jgi:hypothetical protein